MKKERIFNIYKLLLIITCFIFYWFALNILLLSYFSGFITKFQVSGYHLIGISIFYTIMVLFVLYILKYSNVIPTKVTILNIILIITLFFDIYLIANYYISQIIGYLGQYPVKLYDKKFIPNKFSFLIVMIIIVVNIYYISVTKRKELPAVPPRKI